MSAQLQAFLVTEGFTIGGGAFFATIAWLNNRIPPSGEEW